MDQDGGSLTGNQFYKFFISIIKDDDKLLPEDFIPLNKKNNLLYNNKFRAYYNPKNVHFVILHRGTIPSNKKDIFNNVRNFLAIKNKYLITKRNKLAKMGYDEVRKFLIKLYKNKKYYYSTYKSIIDYLDKLINTSPTANIYNSVDELLKTKLTTIGHSQGSVYAYLYGKNGKEIIVYNAPPFIGKKPENTYTIRHKRDPISFFSKSRKMVVLKNKTKSLIEAHSIETLKNVSKIFGDPFLYTDDKELKSNLRSKKNKTRKNKIYGNKTQKNNN